jgi:hypothetical protein
MQNLLPLPHYLRMYHRIQHVWKIGCFIFCVSNDHTYHYKLVLYTPGGISFDLELHKEFPMACHYNRPSQYDPLLGRR